MLYFGTDTNVAGHYLWELTGGMYRSQKRWDSIPFDPYEYKENRKGEGVFVLEKLYTALHIAGSPTDTRFGTVSVFFVNESIPARELFLRIKKNTHAMILINAMPFPVKTSQGDLK